MTNSSNLIPQPTSQFLKVKCNKCNNEQTIFEKASSIIKCEVCDELLAEPTGGKTTIKGEIIQQLR